MKSLSLFALFSILFFHSKLCVAQLPYNTAAAYGLRKIVPTYGGKAIQVRRTCDDATKDIGFTSCGNLDTNALKAFVLASNPLSQISSTAAAVYSLRRMRCNYVGSAIRVMSSAAGNPTLDIGFTAAGDLDTAALKTFVGANSGFVTIWYDQSGNAYDASQPTIANQPRIVNAGVVDRQNGRPAIFFNGNAGSNVLLNNNYSMLVDNQAPTWNAVVVPQTPNDTYSAIVCWRYAGGIESAIEFGPGGNWNTSWWSNTNYNTTNGISVSYGTCQILTSLYNTTSNQFYVNGTLSYNNTGQSNTAALSTNPNGCATTGLRIGNDNCCGGRFVKGYIIEIVMSPTNFSTTDKQFLEWSQAQYYGVSGPVLTTLPASPASASVTVWYDQSGTTKDAVQATILNQPRIMNAGIIEKNGTIPAIYFAGFPQNLVAPLSTNAYPVSLSLIGNTSGNSSGGAFFKLGTSVNAGQAGIAIGIGNSGGTFDAAGTSVIGLKEWVTWSPSNPNVNYPSNPFTSTTIQQTGSGGMTTFLNGTNVPLSNANNGIGASIAGNLFIGGYTNGTNRYATVRESEVIVIPSSISTTGRNLIESQQAVYNSITIASPKYTPPTTTSYNLFVNGVGRESATDSVAGTKNTVGMGLSIGNTAADYLKDNGDYITIGIDCPNTGTTALNVTAPVLQRWNNDWYINITDVNSNGGNITVFFDFGDYGMPLLPGVASNYELLFRNTSSGTFSVVPGTVKSVVGDRVVFVTATPGASSSYFVTIGTTNPGNSTLPIELTAFDLKCDNNAVNINWSTATQFKNDHFSIERTTDGVNFKTIGTLKGEGTSTVKKDYSFIDNNPVEGTAYYRLKQTDFDGSTKDYPLSATNCVTFKNEVVIYPDPNAGVFTIEGVKINSEMRISNALGMLVYDRVVVSSKNLIDLGSLPDGVYFINMINDSGRWSQKFIIQH